MSKKYGLIVPEKSLGKPVFQAAKNVFGSDSESEDDGKRKPILLKPSHNINRQAKIAQDKAVSEDPTVYQYDEVYDEMAGKKMEEKTKAKADKKPRYIENLLKTASKRKIENDRRAERQIQKEREKEGEEFADKEIFVTSAYKKKLEEMKQEEEKEKREEYLEKIGDVTKQQDLGGFYRHLYEQKLGATKEVVNESTSKENETVNNDTRQERNKNRNYRKRQSSTNSKHSDEEDVAPETSQANIANTIVNKKAKLSENIDADSDFATDDSDSDSKEHDKKSTNQAPLPSKVDTNTTKIEDSKKSNENKVEAKDNKIEPIVECKVKIDIWKKRTVGDVFDQALKRYYERKALRG